MIYNDKSSKIRNFLAFVDLFKKRTIFIADGKDHETVKSFVEDVKAHNRKQINFSIITPFSK